MARVELHEVLSHPAGADRIAAGESFHGGFRQPAVAFGFRHDDQTLGLSLDALFGRKGLEDDASHALSVLADEAIAASVEAMKIRDRLRRANDELAAHWDLKSYSMGEVLVGDGLSLEHSRANMAADDCDAAIGHLCVVVERLNNVATTRSMTAQQVADAVKEYERFIEERRGAR